MKKLVIFSCLLSIFPGFMYGEAKVPESTVNETGHWFATSMLLAAAILILLLLALWLLKSSNRLEHTVKNTETNGDNWLKNHLNELDLKQLEILIKLKSRTDSQRFKNQKPDTK